MPRKKFRFPISSFPLFVRNRAWETSRPLSLNVVGCKDYFGFGLEMVQFRRFALILFGLNLIDTLFFFIESTTTPPLSVVPNADDDDNAGSSLLMTRIRKAVTTSQQTKKVQTTSYGRADPINQATFDQERKAPPKTFCNDLPWSKRQPKMEPDLVWWVITAYITVYAVYCNINWNATNSMPMQCIRIRN